MLVVIRPAAAPTSWWRGQPPRAVAHRPPGAERRCGRVSAILWGWRRRAVRSTLVAPGGRCAGGVARATWPSERYTRTDNSQIEHSVAPTPPLSAATMQFLALNRAPLPTVNDPTCSTGTLWRSSGILSQGIEGNNLASLRAATEMTRAKSQAHPPSATLYSLSTSLSSFHAVPRLQQSVDALDPLLTRPGTAGSRVHNTVDHHRGRDVHAAHAVIPTGELEVLADAVAVVAAASPPASRIPHAATARTLVRPPDRPGDRTTPGWRARTPHRPRSAAPPAPPRAYSSSARATAAARCKTQTAPARRRRTVVSPIWSTRRTSACCTDSCSLETPPPILAPSERRCQHGAGAAPPPTATVAAATRSWW
eukprot:ctg_1631.g500